MRTDEALTSGTVGAYEPKASKPRRQQPWSGPECPACGGTRTPVRNSGKDKDGRPLRDRRCGDCGTGFTTIEQVVMGGHGPVPFALVDVEHRRRKRESKRRRFGWNAGGARLRTREVQIAGQPRVNTRRER
jgi:hypothetical protein